MAIRDPVMMFGPKQAEYGGMVMVRIWLEDKLKLGCYEFFLEPNQRKMDLVKQSTATDPARSVAT